MILSKQSVYLAMKAVVFASLYRWKNYPCLTILLIITLFSSITTFVSASKTDNDQYQQTINTNNRTATHILIDRDLNTHEIILNYINTNTFSYIENGIPHITPVNEILGLIKNNVNPRSHNYNTMAYQNQNNSDNAPFIELSDGQRWLGKIGKCSADDDLDYDLDLLKWDHNYFGYLLTPIDKILKIHLHGKTSILSEYAQPQSVKSNDTIKLINGDILTGFVLSICENAVIEYDNNTIDEIPLKRIQNIDFANEPVFSPSGKYVWFESGEIIKIKSITTNKNNNNDAAEVNNDVAYQISLDNKQPVSIALQDINAILFDSAALRGLAELRIIEYTSASDWLKIPFRPKIQTDIQELNLNNIEYYGPITIKYQLPENAVKFATQATIPIEALEWADFDMNFIIDNDTTIYTAHFNINNSSQPISFDIASGSHTLTIHIQAAQHGPVHNSIILQKPRFLLRDNSKQ